MALSEIDALRMVDEALEGLDDAARDRVLRWALAKYSPNLATDRVVVGAPATAAKAGASGPTTPPASAASKVKAATKTRPKTTAPSIVRDLNLQPNGKKSFRDFAESKKPATNGHRGVVAVYYLRHELGIDPISSDHVYTCFKDAGWRVPADLPNALQVIASVKGWLDTKSMKDIKLSTLGENLVEHDLPPKPSKK